VSIIPHQKAIGDSDKPQRATGRTLEMLTASTRDVIQN